MVKPSLKSYEGFTSPSVQTVTVKGDGSLIVDYYYTRNKYKIDDGDKKVVQMMEAIQIPIKVMV